MMIDCADITFGPDVVLEPASMSAVVYNDSHADEMISEMVVLPSDSTGNERP